MHPFLALHRRFRQDLAYLLISDTKSYGYSMKFITLMQAMYEKAFSSVNLLTTLQDPFPDNAPLDKAVAFFLSIGATSYKHQNCTLDKQNRGGGLRGRCHDLCDGTSRHSNRRHLTGLRKGNGCLFEHPNTQSYNGRFVVYIHQHAGQPIFSGNNCMVFRFTSTLVRSGNVTWWRATDNVKALTRGA